MKHLKTFEKILIPQIEEPQVGDYVICSVDVIFFKNLNEFCKYNIGQIIKILEKTGEYLVRFDDAYNSDINSLILYSTNVDKFDVKFSKREIKKFSKDKEELESLVSANKYNL